MTLVSKVSVPSETHFEIGILFYNRAHQTLNCIASFLTHRIRPKILVLDQGSATEQRNTLAEALINWPTVQLITLTENIGVGAGRNLLCRQCSSNWILFVDNDTVLNTPDGIGLINSAIEQGEDVDGYLPIILNVHENRFMEKLRITQRNRRIYEEQIALDVPMTNMFSGCAVLLRRSLLLDEPYDERYFVGFEDYELALRAFVRRKPMRLKSLATLTFAHKHMPVVSDSDVETTRTRYSLPLVAKSFNVLKSQYNDQLFNNWKPWVLKQQEEMIASRRIAPKASDDITNLTFVVDTPDSASGNAFQKLRQHFSPKFALNVVHTRRSDTAGEVLQQILRSNPHIIHFMWRPDVASHICATSLKECATLMDLSESDVVDTICRSHITFSVSDFLYLDQQEVDSFRPLFWLSDGYGATNGRILGIYETLSSYPPPAALLFDSLDRGVASVTSDQQIKRECSSIRIGWKGKAFWNDSTTGLTTIIHPAIDALRARGLDVELIAVYEEESGRDLEANSAFFRSIDIYVCASDTENERRMILEAMTNGIPVVSISVGIGPQVSGPIQQRFIVERSVEALCEALGQLCSDADLRKTIAEENLAQTADRWLCYSTLWESFFTDILKKAHPDAPNWRRFMIDRFFLTS